MEEEIRQIQRMLREISFYDDRIERVIPDGIYGDGYGSRRGFVGRRVCSFLPVSAYECPGKISDYADPPVFFPGLAADAGSGLSR